MKKKLLLVFTLIAALVYRYRRLIVGWSMGLQPAPYGVQVRRNVRVPMFDEVTLATDHYAPVDRTGRKLAFPTILIRTPYSRRLAPVFAAHRFAERGYNVLLQDVRGRFGSEGMFEPFVDEGEDGLATLSWLEQQPWHNGRVGTWGQSYLGYVQWALATACDAEGRLAAVDALVPSIASSRGLRTATVENVLSLDLPLRWMLLLDALEHLPGGHERLTLDAFVRLTARGQSRVLAPAFSHLPLAECDELLLGEEVPVYRQMFGDTVPDRLQATDLSQRVADVEAPVHLIGGWYDFMLHDLLDDFSAVQQAALARADRQPYLTVGPWQHMNREVNRTSLREGLAWFDTHLKGQEERLRAQPVRLYVMGAEEWREYDSWPPPSQQVLYYLQDGRALGAAPPDRAEPDHYRYDPAQPTPAVGGPLFFTGAGAHDNRVLEARSDVLTYTTPVLREKVEVVGYVRAVLYVRSSLEHTDFFARLCDLHPDGRSMNICDGIVRLRPGKGQEEADGSFRIEIDMWATAHAFLPGHAIRLQVSSGAHPRYARNLGTGAQPGHGVEMLVAEQTVYHDARHPAALLLPVVG